MFWKAFLWNLPKILLFVAYGALQFLEPTSFGEEDGIMRHFAISVHQKKLYVALSLGLLYAIAELVYQVSPYSPRKQAKEFRQKIMETMLEELFENDKNNVRITIFKDANRFRKIKICFKCWWAGIKFKWKSYVIVWERLGTEHPNSKTFFYFNPETQRTSEGIAGKVRQAQEARLVEDLPDLENINLDKVILRDKSSGAVQKINEYMRRGYIDDFKTLKRLNRKSRHIYGTVLTNQLGEFKGVLVIDSFNENSPFDYPILDNVQYYVKLIATTM